ncbi:MAG: succinylglutamate desuccinylase/aspartoacylase family protein [Gammaproteobacteria bacterium]|nr:succinylglutamate desuccinylase/aspartoacylase family protein [Gammaproteobacteria bacterium]
MDCTSWTRFRSLGRSILRQPGAGPAGTRVESELSELLNERSDFPLSLLDIEADGLHAVLGGPTLFHIDGRREPALFVSVLMHGNETTGWDAIRRVLRKYMGTDGFDLPRSLSLFVGNTAAAQAGVRHLDDQPDFNRVWPGSETSGTTAHELMRKVMDTMADRELFASIDVHNNTGLNPHYACVNVLEHSSLHLAALFGRTVVYFVRPRGVASMAMAALGPSVTLECGKVGHAHGVDHAADYLDACLHLAEIPNHPVARHDVDLYHTVAIVRVPAGQAFGFGDDAAPVNFPRNLDVMNFRELPVGTLFAELGNGSTIPLDVRDEEDRLVSDRFFAVEDDRLVTRVPVMPSMLTRDPLVIRQDCLCYLMERYDEHLADAG